MISKKVDKRIMAARMNVSHNFPYFSSGFWLMRFYETELIPTMGITPTMAVAYNPNFLDDLSQQEIEGVLVHELMHVLRFHADRRMNRDALKWNIAADIEINDNLLDDGFCLPTGDSGALFSSSYNLDKGLSAEEYYEKIPQNEEGNEEGNGVCSGDCGSGSGGEAGDWEKEIGEEEKKTLGDQGVTKVDVDLTREEIAKAVQHTQRTAGNVPGSIVRWAEDFLSPPQVDWRKQLAFKLRSEINSARKGFDNYSYKKPSRRSTCFPNIILPSMVAADLPKIAAIIDTSGSIDENELSLFLSELQGIIQNTGVFQVRVLTCDAAVHTDINVRKIADLKNKIVGCGGTDLREGFKALEGKDKPKICVVFTDGYTPWPEQKTIDKTIVVICNNSDQTGPSWATTIKLN